MFVQIHMLQSMPPGNLNRDETGQPKKCLFGGVTRGRISSQCLKRNIRMSPDFSFARADRTRYLPQMVADALKKGGLGIPEDELDDLMAAIAAGFKKEMRGTESEVTEEAEDAAEGQADPSEAPKGDNDTGTTGQVVFFPPPFAGRIAELIADFRKNKPDAYKDFLKRDKKTKATKYEKKAWEAQIKQLVKACAEASKKLTVDIGLFGRMTTSDWVVNVEACCQVAHAIGTHETLIERDYFTTMDDKKAEYASSQSDTAGAAFLGRGENETYHSANVYYKYLNVDLASLRDEKHLPSLSLADAAKVAGILIRAAALATPTGKQNAFASHSVPEYVLVEVSRRILHRPRKALWRSALRRKPLRHSVRPPGGINSGPMPGPPPQAFSFVPSRANAPAARTLPPRATAYPPLHCAEQPCAVS